MDDLRGPWSVPDPDVPHLDVPRLDVPRPGPAGTDVTSGYDTDGDGHGDTVVTGHGIDLVLLTDLDGDGFADRVLRIGPDGVAREVGFRVTETADPAAADPDGEW